MFILVLCLLAVALAGVPESGSKYICEGELEDSFICLAAEEYLFGAIETVAPLGHEYISDAMRQLNDGYVNRAAELTKTEGHKLADKAAEFVRKVLGAVQTTKDYFPEKYERLTLNVLRVVDEIFALATSPDVKRCVIGTTIKVTNIIDGE